MRIRADIAAVRPDGKPVLLVEVKGRLGASDKWATEYRRNLVAHRFIELLSYFMLVTPEQVFLWKPGLEGAEAPPDFVGDAGSILSEYKRFGNQTGKPSGPALDSLVFAWLTELLDKPDSSSAPDWIRGSGLVEAIRGTHLETQTAA